MISISAGRPWGDFVYCDPDGNGWAVQAIPRPGLTTASAPQRVTTSLTVSSR